MALVDGALIGAAFNLSVGDSGTFPLPPYCRYQSRTGTCWPPADHKDLWAACGPDRDNLCLYSYPDGNWAVDLPVVEVPPELPEPVLGINFARDGEAQLRFSCLDCSHYCTGD